jgi:ketosteroid isomerase-like protein
MRTRTYPDLVAAIVLSFASARAFAHADDAAMVAALDVAYQAAVERSDWQAMDRILHPDFILVLGDGKTYTRAQLIDSTRKRNVVFDTQSEVPGTQKVRLFGEGTATVTALLRLKGKRSKSSEAFDFQLWFTDTYVRTAQGWRYAFGQASSPLVEAQATKP